jgi:hypothetical protein
MSLTLTPQSLQFIDGASGSTEQGTSIATDSAGNVYVCGYTNSTASGNFTFAGTVFQKPATLLEAIYIGKIDANGVPIWLVMLDGSTSFADRAQSISVDNNGNVYVTGSTSTSTGSTTAFTFGTCVLSGVPATATYSKPITSDRAIILLKLDTTGALQWLRTLDGSIREEGFSITADSSGSVYFTGYTNGTSAGNNIVYGTCLPSPTLATTVIYTKPATTLESVVIGNINLSTGALNWVRLLNGVESIAGERGTGIAFEYSYSGDIVVTGYTNATGTSIDFISCLTGGNSSTQTLTKPTTTGSALFLMRIDDNAGTIQWMTILDAAGDQRGVAVTVGYDTLGDPKVYVTGTATVAASPVFTMTYSTVLGNAPPTTIWNTPAISQTATMIARIDFGDVSSPSDGGTLEYLKFFDILNNPETPTAIAVKFDYPGSEVYVSGYSTSGGGSVDFGTAAISPAPATTVTYPVPVLNSDNGFLLKLDESLNYLESKWIDGGNNYFLNNVSVDQQDNVYVIGYTDTIAAGPVNFGDVVFQKPLTTNISAFVVKLKNLSSSSLSAICYAKGTLIGTDRGFVPIEDIRLSDKLRTYDCIKETTFKPVGGIPFKTLTRVEDTRFKNRFANIKFIGHFTVNFMHEKTAPIRITAGALGPSKPERDLLVSPNHSMLIGNRLIFAKNLVNGSTIYQDMSFKKIEYYHILSDDHYLINANGAMSETLGTEELKLFETMIYAQSNVYKPLASENKIHLQNVEMAF